MVNFRASDRARRNWANVGASALFTTPIISAMWACVGSNCDKMWDGHGMLIFIVGFEAIRLLV